MNYSKKSWHYWLYDHTYRYEVSNNFCEYCWSLILAMLLFIPLTIFFIPYIILCAIESLVRKTKFEYPVYFVDGEYAFLSVVLFIVLFFMSAMWFYIPVSWQTSSPIFQAGCVVWCVIILILAVWGVLEIEYQIKKRRKGLPPREKKPSIFKAFFKALKEKHCSKINWTD